ncbi:Endonuclease/exonuclease/phosphatase, partial [Earliella scabrosa]
RKKSKPRTKAKLKFASLNMRGGGPIGGPPEGDKWLMLNQLMRDNRIAVMALQETHLTNERHETLRRLFGDVLEIVSSPDPDNPTGARGVAIAINKRILTHGATACTTLVPGRAVKATLSQREGASIEVLAVYAPNDSANNARFWEYLRNDNRSQCDIMLGDFNLVEDAIDRLPSRHDDASATDELSQLRTKLGLVDGWRHKNDSLKAYTYLQQATGSQSRLDRIYLRKSLVTRSMGWDIVDPGLPTDHRMPVCELANFRVPFIGQGRWTVPAGLLKNKDFIGAVCEAGRKLAQSVEAIPEGGVGLQEQYCAFKDGVKALAKDWAKRCIPKLDRRIDRLKGELNALLQDGGAADLVAEAAKLQRRLAHLEERRFGQKRAAVKAKDWAEGETLSRYWTRSSKKPMP